MSPALQSRIPIALALLVVLVCGALSFYYFHTSYFEPDTVSYLFQANLFARLRLTADPPPDRGFSPSIHINIVNHKWYSLYPFGNALLLSVGALAGVAWLIPCLATGASVFVLYKLLSHIYSLPHALLGTVLAALSPATLVMGATCFAEVTDRLFLSLYLLGIAHMFGPVRTAAPTLTGLALGMALNTRPLTAVAFGLAWAGFWLYALVTASVKARLYRWAVYFLLGFTVGLVSYFGWNYVCTGSFTKSAYNADQPYVILGFGPRAEGNIIDPAREVVYTPARALERLVTKTIPAVVVNTLGWGYYDPRINKQIATDSSSSLVLAIELLPGLLTLIIMALPLLDSSRTRWDFLFGSIVVFNLVCYYFYWFDAATGGFTPTHSRYYTEATMLAVVPLLARGLFIAHRRVKDSGKHGSLVFRLALALLFINSLYTYSRYTRPLRMRGADLAAMGRLVQDKRVHNAVVFTQASAVPLGDYPFRTSLEQADVVYFRLGSSKRWALNFSDWRPAYQRFFHGRRAYLFQDGSLILLSP